MPEGVELWLGPAVQEVLGVWVAIALPVPVADGEGLVVAAQVTLGVRDGGALGEALEESECEEVCVDDIVGETKGLVVPEEVGVGLAEAMGDALEVRERVEGGVPEHVEEGVVVGFTVG